MVKSYAPIIAIFLEIFSMGCNFRREKIAQSDRLRILMDTPPATLNPRHTLDAAGQRINALMFRGLTRIDENLEPQGDLAQSWAVSEGGRAWKFTIRPDLKDHAGKEISSSDLLECLENYRIGKPSSPFKESFSSWTGTELGSDGKSLILHLERPDPYVARNLSLLRFYRDASGQDSPCSELKEGAVPVSNGLYFPVSWKMNPESEFSLESKDSHRRSLQFLFVRDENTKAIQLLRGEVDIVQNSIDLSKTKWIKDQLRSRYQVIERDGVSVAYLAFNLRDPILSKPSVRRAIAMAIDRNRIIETKFSGFAKEAGSFLSPLLPESYQTRILYDPKGAQDLLDIAGFIRNKEGIRLSLHYKTTPSREGIEVAQIFQEMLKPIGIRLVVDVVEPAVFFASIRKGAFQLYSSRWLGIADGSILNRTLRTSHLSNRVGYSSSKMDDLLDRASREMDLQRRKEILKEVQILMAQDLPYFPLWYWNNTVIFNKSLTGLEPSQISLSGTFEPITRLR